MKITVEIYDTKQDLRRTYHTGWDFNPTGSEEALEFIWSEGNYSCDCNRSLFFSYASGEKEPYKQGPEHPNYSDCNPGPNRFKVKVMDETGKVHYED